MQEVAKQEQEEPEKLEDNVQIDESALSAGPVIVDTDAPPDTMTIQEVVGQKQAIEEATKKALKTNKVK